MLRNNVLKLDQSSVISMSKGKASTFKTDIRIFVILDFHRMVFSRIESLKEKLKTTLECFKPQVQEELEKEQRLIQKLKLQPEGLMFKEIYMQAGGLSKTTVAACLKRFREKNYVSAVKEGRRKFYKITDREGILYYILGKMGDFRRVQSLFWKTVKRPADWSFLMFWTAVTEEEMRRALRHIDRLTLSPKHLRFIGLYEDYLWNSIPEDTLEHMSFEDYYVSRTGEGVHPPSTLLWMYMDMTHPEIEKLYPIKKEGWQVYPSRWDLLRHLKEYKAVHGEKEKTIKGKHFRNTRSVPLPQELSKLPFFSSASCPECENQTFIWDYTTEEVICKKCGVVVYPS